MSLLKYFGFHFVKYRGTGNVLTVHYKGGRVVRNPRVIRGIRVKFTGDNAMLELHSQKSRHGLRGGKIRLESGARCVIGSGCDGIITIYGGKNCRVNIGDNCSLGKTRFILSGIDGASISVGRDCMFATGVCVYATDTHQILDAEHKHILNDTKKDLEIGNHVWVGLNAIILKGTLVSNNSIIGAGAVVSGRFDTSNVIIAGNPARVIRKAIDWDIAPISDGIN